MMAWMFSCKRAAELMSAAMDEPLDWPARLKLRLHLSMCRNCSRVEQQMLALRTLGQDLFGANPDTDEAPATADRAASNRSPSEHDKPA